MDAIAYLFALEKLGIKFGLDNIAAILESLGNPHSAYPSILIAGTNGKGSTTAMVERALRHSGRRTGRYTSPHLVALGERFVVSGQQASETDIREVAELVRDHVDAAITSGRLETQPTFFEVTTAMAFELFRRRRVEIAVLEVGLGGRFDSTNIVTPLVTAITSIALDHQQLLGSTLEAIAREKAGIIKPGVPVVVGRMTPEAGRVITEVAASVKAPEIRADDVIRMAVRVTDGRSMIELQTARRDYGPVTLALLGRHQIDNALVAVAVLETLETAGFEVGRNAVRAGLEDVCWPGRLDLRTMPDGRRVLFDAAHNPAGAAAVAAYLRDSVPRGLPVVFAAMADKDWRGMLRTLGTVATHFVVTRATNSRAADPALIAEEARALGTTAVEIVEPPAAALEHAWRHGSMVAVTGSIFLVGEILGGLDGAQMRRP